MLKTSEVLKKLAYILEEDETYSVERLLSLGSFLGYCDRGDQTYLQQERERLSAIPRRHNWRQPGKSEGQSLVHWEWPGSYWIQALTCAEQTRDCCCTV